MKVTMPTGPELLKSRESGEGDCNNLQRAEMPEATLIFIRYLSSLLTSGKDEEGTQQVGSETHLIK